MRHVGGRKCIDMAGRERWYLKHIANLDANGVSRDLFVQFVGDGCLVDKARGRPVLVLLTLYDSIRLFLS